MEIKKEQYKNLNDGDWWYDLADGGYIKPEELLVDPEDAKKVLEAVKVVKAFQDAYEKALWEMEESDDEDE